MFYDKYLEPVEIGAGAFGTVYQALDPKAGRYVAIKECACGRSSVLKEEYTLLKSLDHPNIVPVYDFNAAEDGYVIITMELASGGSLRELLVKSQFRLFEGTVRNLFADALSGLAYLHEHGVVHCDIKPENMLVFGDHVKLCDFGLSRQCVGNASAGHQTLNISGTPRYMAPELWITNTYTSSADMWGLAMTVIELTSGKKPWEDEVDTTVSVYPVIFFLHNLYQNPHSYKPESIVPSHLSQPLRAILLDMLQLDAKKRPSARAVLSNEYFNEASPFCIDGSTGGETEADYDHEMRRRHSASIAHSQHSRSSIGGGGSAGASWVGAEHSSNTKETVMLMPALSEVVSSSASSNTAVHLAPPPTAPVAQSTSTTTTTTETVSRSKKSQSPTSTKSKSSSIGVVAKVVSGLFGTAQRRATPTATQAEAKQALLHMPASSSRGAPPAQKHLLKESPKSSVTQPKTTSSNVLLEGNGQEVKVVWSFRNGRQACPYDESLQKGIEEAFQQGKRTHAVETVRLLDGAVARYELNFEKMWQQNLATRYQRRIYRECVEVAPAVQSAPSSRTNAEGGMVTDAIAAPVSFVRDEI